MRTTAAPEARIWDRAEALPREELRTLQLQRLRQTMGRVLHGQRLGAQRLASTGLTEPEDLRSLDELDRIPFATKADLREHYPFGLLAVPRQQLVRVHASSGTHGKPTVVGYTRHDVETWTELMARCMTMAGVRPGMVIHNANGYGLFTGGHGFHQGGERIGATVVPVSGGRTARQAMLLADLGAHVLIATPSYALVIAQALGEAGIDARQLPLALGLFGGEPWGEKLRAEVEEALGIDAISFYGLSEMCGPGVAAECLAGRDGLHVQEDHFFVEVIDPGDGRKLGPESEGELVFTTLTKEALPLIRYRTGDIGSLVDQPCQCGRTTVRLRGLRGRRDDMLIVRGVNLHPSKVERVLGSVEGTTSHWRLMLERPGALDELTLQCEAAEGCDHGLLRSRLEASLRDETGLRISVAVLPPGSVPRSEGKAARVVDRRERPGD
ncbi:MAG: phenylacetate--CoA ligase [Solirubrobacterales bacterium]|nr:phenylacetate--CoA ligase [Solirubrobacterales bacterium]